MKRILIVSPREPSGATWLINCFLCLGIHTYRVSLDRMWKRRKGRWFLSPEEDALKQWLPILSAKESFSFREDVRVCWTHEWPQEKHRDQKVIYFVRDPRDALYSRYCREAPRMSYRDFVSIRHPKYLISKVDYWSLFHRMWGRHPDLQIFRFEDYKKNPEVLLRKILLWSGLEFSDDEVRSAIEASSSEQAARAEKEYLISNPGSGEIVNQGGRTGRWRENLVETELVTQMIEARCGDLLKELNYELAYGETQKSHTSLDTIARHVMHFRKSEGYFPDAGPDDFDDAPEIQSLAQLVYSKQYQQDWKDGGRGRFLASAMDYLSAAGIALKIQPEPLSPLDRYHLAAARPTLENIRELNLKYAIKFFSRGWRKT